MSIPLEAVVGELHIIGGARQGVTRPTAALVPPRRAARGRAGDTLFVLVELRGPDSLPYESVIDCIQTTYWKTPGTVTSALRAALVATNDWLMDRNLKLEVSDRLRMGVSCAVLRGADLYIAQAGPAAAYVAHQGRVDRFPVRDVAAPAMGASRGVDVRFSHAALNPGDTLLLCDSSTAERTPEAAIASATVYTGVETALYNLERLAGSGDLIAMVVEGAAEPRTKAAIAAAVQGPAPRPARLPEPERVEAPKPAVPIRPPKSVQPVPEPARPLRASRPEPEPILAEVEEPEPEEEEGRGPSWAQRAGGWLQSSLGSIRLRRRLVSIAGSFGAGMAVLAHGIGTVLARTLPESALSRQGGRGSNRALIALAILIPLAVAAVVAVMYFKSANDARFESLLNDARKFAAEAPGLKDKATQRLRWTSAFDQAGLALDMRPGNMDARAVRDQAQRELDKLDGVARVNVNLLWDFKSPGARRVAVQGVALYVFDRQAGRVVELTLNESGTGIKDFGKKPDGTPNTDPPIRAARATSLKARQVGDLVDMAWMAAGGTRTRSSLVILDSLGLLDYDPQFGLDSVAFGSGPVPSGSKLVAGFGGNLYVLDTVAGQIWRYKSQGNGYGGTPEKYFDTMPGDLSNVTDMAIDGNIYLLHADGRIRKFLAGKEVTFAVSGMAEPIKKAVSLAVDADRRTALFVADAGGGGTDGRIVQLGTDGVFVQQIRATLDEFGALEDVVVDQGNGRLFVMSGGKLYTGRLPAPSR